jgi:hypothetical protein
MERRFGALLASVEERVWAADKAVLEEWGLRTLEAGSLENVFNEI